MSTKLSALPPDAGPEAQRDLPGDHASVPPPAAIQEPCETHSDTHTTCIASLTCVCTWMSCTLTHCCEMSKHLFLPPLPSLPSPQVYRSVLLNNGHRTLPSPDSPSDEGSKVQSPPATSTSAKSPSPAAGETSKKSPSPGEAEPVVKQEPSVIGRMVEGERGDIIHFYNKVSCWCVWSCGAEGRGVTNVWCGSGLHWIHQGVCTAVPKGSR